MKKIILIVLALALVVPSAAMAAAEFSLGGFIKLDAFWDSSQEGKNMNTAVVRNNDPNAHHGRLKFTAQGSRFNFTIKGPKLWGATTTGFIEMDFDERADGTAGFNSGGASNGYTPRLRHAMFRLNWPGTELLFGQYWSMFCEWWPELAQDGPFQLTGIPTARLAQIRFTQKFAGAWRVAALIGEPNNAAGGRAFNAAEGHSSGESGEMPQIQGLVSYQQDLWGKSAYYGVPTPFTVQLAGGIQRNVFNGNIGQNGALTTVQQFGQNNFNALNVKTGNQYLYPWLLMASTFIPVIPTHSANLAGTAAIQTQWWIGQGVEAFGFTNVAGNILSRTGNTVFDPAFGANIFVWSYQLQNRFGGYVQGQYYFTNDWFMTAAWAMSRAFGVGVGEQEAGAPNQGNTKALTADSLDYHQEFDLCLWYRPIKAIKFGLQYSYNRTNYFQIRTNNAAAGSGFNPSKFGDAHNVRFVGFFYF